MKRVWILVLTVFAIVPAFGQQQTLLTGKIDHGGYGGPVLKGIQIGNETGLMVGGRGGWIINHTFVLGGGGYGLVTEIDAPGDSLLNLGYGGLTLGLVLKSDELIHLTVGSMFGAGGIGLRSKDGIDIDEGVRSEHNEFFLIEPEVTAELNITPFFRISGGVSYQYFNGIDAFGFTDDDFSGFAADIQFKFGSF